MDVALDGVAFVANDETGKMDRQKVVDRSRYGETYIMGFKSWRIIVLTSCAVNSNEPSPTNSIVLRLPVSFAASAAP